MSLLDKINEYKQRNPTGWRRWLVGILVGAVSLSLLVVFYLRTIGKSNEIAKLKHERDVALERHKRAELDAKLSANKTEIEGHKIAAEDALIRAEALEARIEEIEAQHLARRSIIDSIRSWEDVDAKVR
ncbi:hypothetical protein HC928_03660 [bacterium]|nr:hypothetical protein [bacterium]